MIVHAPHTDPDDDLLEFADESVETPALSMPVPWTVLVVDDDREVHAISRLALRGLRYKDREIFLLNAYSAEEARILLQAHPEIALILLDVVMETEMAGLDLVGFIRDQLGNRLIQIILRTGQPGRAPENRVIVEYEINDYKEKTELTAQKLFSSVLTSLRTYDFAASLERQKAEMARIMLASSRFVPTQSLAVLGKESIVDAALGDQVQRDMSILFADIRGFTRLCERLTPAETIDFLNQLMGRLAPVIRRHHGFIDKYLGDGILALFPGNADDAVDAGIALRACLGEFNLREDRSGLAPVRMGMGIHSGPLMLGIVGEPERVEVTVLADAVNTASRIESLTKDYDVDILISEETLRRLEHPDRYHFRHVDKVKPRGKAIGISVFELLHGGPDSERKLETQDLYEQGLTMYRLRRFAEASVCFSRVLEQNPADEVARIYLKRVAEYMVRGTPADWER